jgi:WD40 repeat protein
VRDATTGARTAELSPSFGAGQWVDVAPDGARVAVAGLGDTVDVWAPATGVRWTTPGGGGPAVAAFRADGALVTGHGGGALRLWDPDGAREAEVAIDCAVVHVVALRELVVAGCRGGDLRAWSPARGRAIALATGVESTPASAPDRATLYAGASGGRVLAWTEAELAAALDGGPAPTGRELGADPSAPVFRVLPTPTAPLIVIARGHAEVHDERRASHRDAGLSPGLQPLAAGARLLVGSRSDGAVIGRELGRGEEVLRLHGHRPADPIQVAASADGTRVVSITAAGEAWLWAAGSGAVDGRLAHHRGEVAAIAIDPAGTRAITVGVDGAVRLERLDGAGSLEAAAGAAVITAAAAAGVVVTGGDDGIARWWTGTGIAPRARTIGDAVVAAVALAPSATSAAAGDLDGRAAWWWTADGASIARLEVAGDPVAAIARAPHHPSGATRHPSGAVRLWDRQGAPLAAFTGDGAVRTLAIAADGALAAGHDGERTQVARIVDGWRPRELAGRPAGPAAWAADGTLLLVDAGGRIALWRPAGEVVLAANGPPVVAAAWSCDGARCFSGDAGGTVTIWDATRGRRLLTIGDGGEGTPTVLAPTADGRWLAIGTTTGAVRVVPVGDDAAREAACARLRRYARAPADCPPAGH